MSYRRMIFSIVLGGALFLVSCDPGTPTPPPDATPATGVSAGPVLSVVEKQNPSLELPDIHIFVDDSKSMEEDDRACDIPRTRIDFAHFLYRVIDKWKMEGFVSPDQQTSVWILNANPPIGFSKNFANDELLTWLKSNINGNSGNHWLAHIFSHITNNTDTFKDGSVFMFITDGDFRAEFNKDYPWTNDKTVVVNGLQDLSERNINTYYMLICPEKLVDSDIDNVPDYKMLNDWALEIPAPRLLGDEKSVFVYGIDLDEKNNNKILEAQTNFDQKKTKVLRELLSDLIERYQLSEGYRLFGIDSRNGIKSLIENLDIGVFPEGARAAFKLHGIILPDSVQVNVITNGIIWEVAGDDTYIIKDEQQVLGVYAHKMVNLKIINPGDEDQFSVSPYALFFDVQMMPYNSNDLPAIKLDNNELPVPHYLFPVDSNDCNMAHSVRVFNGNSPLLLQWWNQPFALTIEPTDSMAIFYNDSGIRLYLQDSPNYIFEWDSWRKCIQVHVVYSDDVFRDYMIEKDDITGNYVLNIEDLMVTDLFQQANLELSFYWGNSMDIGIQIGDPIKLPYKRIHYPYLFINANPYVQDGNLILPYAYHPGLGQGDEYQPVLYFYGANCDISKPDYFKPTGSPHKGVDFEETSFEKYSIKFIDQGIDYMGCTSMDVDWDGDAYRRIVEESRIPKDLSCDLEWQSNGYLLDVKCYEK